MNSSEVRLGFAEVEAALERDGVYAAMTDGGSMRPLFRTHRDVVMIKPLTDEPQKYDAVLYRLGDKYVLHRVIGYDKSGGVYIIRGDNTFVKERVPRQAMIGVLSAFRRGSSYKSIDALSYKVYCRVWNFLYPIRFLVHKCRLCLGRLKRRIIKK